jgi:hypothetical protein
VEQVDKKKNGESAPLRLLDRVALTLLFAFILGEVLGGAIRYYSVQFHLQALPYLPHLMVAVALLPMFFAYFIGEGVTPTFLLVFGLIAVATTWGAFNVGNADQVEFGLWIYVAFLYGIVVLPAIIRGWQKLTPYIFFLWAVAVGGVLINYFHTWPWIGLQYQVGATSIEASRLWTAGALGFDRLPGFSRASFDTAVQILVFSTYLAGALRKKWWIPVWVLSGAAIVLTTDKTVAGIFILFSIGGAFRRHPIRPFWKRLLPALAFMDIVLPFSMLFIKIDWTSAIRSHVWVGLIASFVERLQTGWPDWLRMIVLHGNFLLGRGMGGIGSPQQYFEPAFFSPGDNIGVYLFGIFGIPGLFLLLIYARNASRSLGDAPATRFLFLGACIVMLHGVTSNVVEETLLALMFGSSLRYFQERAAGVRILERKVIASRAAPHFRDSEQPEGAV